MALGAVWIEPPSRFFSLPPYARSLWCSREHRRPLPPALHRNRETRLSSSLSFGLGVLKRLLRSPNGWGRDAAFFFILPSRNYPLSFSDENFSCKTPRNVSSSGSPRYPQDVPGSLPPMPLDFEQVLILRLRRPKVFQRLQVEELYFYLCACPKVDFTPPPLKLVWATRALFLSFPLTSLSIVFVQGRRFHSGHV